MISMELFTYVYSDLTTNPNHTHPLHKFYRSSSPMTSRLSSCPSTSTTATTILSTVWSMPGPSVACRPALTGDRTTTSSSFGVVPASTD